MSAHKYAKMSQKGNLLQEQASSWLIPIGLRQVDRLGT